MTSHRCTVAILTLALVAPFAALAQSSAPMASKPMADAASGGKAKAPRPRVSGGPGYVSEGAAASSPSASAPAGKKVRARVTGGPGGTAP